MEATIYEKATKAIETFLDRKGYDILERCWTHDSDSIDFIAMGDKELVFVDVAIKSGGYAMPKEEPDQERFEHIAVAYLSATEVESLTSSRYDIASLR